MPDHDSELRLDSIRWTGSMIPDRIAHDLLSSLCYFSSLHQSMTPADISCS